MNLVKNLCSISLFFLEHICLSRGREVDENYPKVFKFDVPVDKIGDEEIVTFVSNIDLLNAIPSEDNVTLSLKFLVHNREELDDISIDKLVLDIEETKKLKESASIPPITGQSSETISGYPCYRNVAGMIKLMQSLKEKANSIDMLKVEILDIGDSCEGSDIIALKITGEGVASRGMSTNKGIMLIIAGLHAREFSPPELVARWAELLINKYGKDIEITSILDHTEVHIILESNPDGRHIAETDKQYWRKNTRPGCLHTPGVDLNRNFPFEWGRLDGSSANLCSNTYHGSFPKSEPETQAIVAYAKLIFPEKRRGIFIDIHSFGELILWPYDYTLDTLTPDEDSLQALARKIKYFNQYALAGPSQSVFWYPASGTTIDWAYGELTVFSLFYELGTSFFQDCPTFNNQIMPDNLPSLTYAAKLSTTPFSLAKGPDIISIIIEQKNSEEITVTFTVSDSAMSAGPGGHTTSTQNILYTTLSIDIHPYDVDNAGNGPKFLRVYADTNSDFITQSVSFSLSSIAIINGKHVLYAYGTDSEGYDGPVIAKLFHIQPNKKPKKPKKKKKKPKKKNKKLKKKQEKQSS